jgi:hypothetical protein
MDEADRYALEMLRRLEQQLAAFNSTVRAGIEALEERTAEPEPSAPAFPQPSQDMDDREDYLAR